jgi:hypothetical protein
VEGEIAFRISKHLGIELDEVLRRKFSHDWRIRWLWRRYYLEIKADNEIAKDIENNKN